MNGGNVQPTQPAQQLQPVSSPPKGSGKKKIIIVIVIVVILLILGGTGFYFWKVFKNKVLEPTKDIKKTVETQVPDKTAQSDSSETTNPNRVKGKSDGNHPLAPIDEENVVTGGVGKSGKVLSTTLPNGVKVYLNIGDVIESADAVLLPYKEMPTTPEHLALSNELGYGVEVILQSIQMGLGGYLIFDLRQGEATEEAQNVSKYYNRCDPTKIYFNPLICARKKGVPADKLIDKNYAVARPVYADDDRPVFTTPTYYVGIDGLLVARIPSGGTYIPQKLDKELAQDLADDTIGNFMNNGEEMEAATILTEWELLDNLTFDQADDLLNGFFNEDYFSFLRGIFVADAITAFAQNRSDSTTNEDDADDWLYIAEEFELIAEEAPGLIYEDAVFDSGENGPVSIGALEGASVVGGLDDAGVSGADSASDTMAGNFEESGFGSTASDPLGAAEANQLLGNEEAANENLDEYKDSVRDKINDILNDPNASITDIIRAMEMAQLLGLDDEFMDDLMEKLRKKIEDEINDPNTSKSRLIELAELCQAIGFDDLADKALGKAGLKGDKPSGDECDQVNKTLKNYGIQGCD